MAEEAARALPPKKKAAHRGSRAAAAFAGDAPRWRGARTKAGKPAANRCAQQRHPCFVRASRRAGRLPNWRYTGRDIPASVATPRSMADEALGARVAEAHVSAMLALSDGFEPTRRARSSRHPLEACSAAPGPPDLVPVVDGGRGRRRSRSSSSTRRRRSAGFAVRGARVRSTRASCAASTRPAGAPPRRPRRANATGGSACNRASTR